VVLGTVAGLDGKPKSTRYPARSPVPLETNEASRLRKQGGHGLDKEPLDGRDLPDRNESAVGSFLAVSSSAALNT
jgi:hypothetical protein